MNELIVYQGSGGYTASCGGQNCYVYYIGAGILRGGKFLGVNNARRLNEIARDVAPKYAEWIYSLRYSFAHDYLIVDGLSLFFLTDLSCKRSEFFSTFNQICNLILLREILEETSFDSIRLIGTDKSFNTALRSISADIPILEISAVETRIKVIKRVAVDCWFVLKIMAVICMNAVLSTQGHRHPNNNCRQEQIFLSFFPSMFEGGREHKYGSLIKNCSDLAFMIMADGMHQQISLKKYWGYAKQVERLGSTLVDRFLRPADLLRGVFWGIKFWGWYAVKRRSAYIFNGLDVTPLLREELRFSVSRVMRLGILKGAVSRMLTRYSPQKLFFYPAEYPLGRLVSWITAQKGCETMSIGYQMGITSSRRTENHLAAGEACNTSPFVDHAPIPDVMMVEDEQAERIYSDAGYQNVERLSEGFRFVPVEIDKSNRRPGQCLIAPGLHDGSKVLEFMTERIRENNQKTWILKPHPRGDRHYLQEAAKISNLQISERPISELLGLVSEVFVTYSSVGLESRNLGLKTTVINIPGYVSFSPLMD